VYFGNGMACRCQRFFLLAGAFACFLGDVTFGAGKITLCTGITAGVRRLVREIESVAEHGDGADRNWDSSEQSHTNAVKALANCDRLC
jgi:hypothetical protein